MSTAEQDQELVAQLSGHMARKLEANRDLRHWSHAPNAYLFTRLEQEVRELREAVFERHEDRSVWGEAADVANFAAMIAENNTDGPT